jgi:hypothetical protein
MDSTSPSSGRHPGAELADQTVRGLDAPVRIARERPRRDWLSLAWTAIFVIYCAAVLPLLGWAIVQAF